MSNIEFEARILEIDHNEIVAKLEALGAKKVKDVFQRRYVYDFNPIQKHKYIRVRTDGIKTTLSIKQVEKDTIDGTKELEIEVSDFEKANEILNILGYFPKGYQESKRLEYKLDNVVFDIDTWPLIPEFMEIEGPNAESVWNMVDLLKIPREKVITSGAYEHYGIDSTELENLSFDMQSNNSAYLIKK